MKVYIVNYTTSDQSNGGYSYHSSKADALKAVRGIREGEAELWLTVNIELSKRGLLRALNKLGGHPDNG